MRIKDDDILTKAKNIVENDRNKDYGPFKQSFGRIANYWNLYLGNLRNSGKYHVDGKDVAMMMTLFKIAREENKHKEDNIVDCIGYLYLYEKLCKSEEDFEDEWRTAVK